ncbi:MAG: hypothetical protein JWN70_428 [Planctomycetaceae bacterium]|nr:hypothetical protein [Planctomycetaceae bacterium]
MKTTTPSCSQVLLTLACLFLSGCGASGLNFNFSKEKVEKESADNPVEQLVPVWQEAEGPGINPAHVTRGFGGQIYFITRQRGAPSEVNGKVRIYLFDDHGDVEERSKPIHQFDFDAGAWTAHLIKSKLGPAYSVFIPYTPPDNLATECALRIRYTPAEGSPVYSQMVKITLGGVKKPADYETVADPKSKSVEALTEVVIPEVTRRGRKPGRDIEVVAEVTPDSESRATPRRKPASKIEQASANGDLVERTGLQTAEYETPAGRQRDQGRIRPADYEEDDAPATRRKHVGDENLDFLGNEEEAEEMPIRRAEPRRIRDSRQTDLSSSEEPERPAPKLRSYTIPLDQ